MKFFMLPIFLLVTLGCDFLSGTNPIPGDSNGDDPEPPPPCTESGDFVSPQPTVMSGGILRTYALYVPGCIDPQVPTPVVFFYYGLHFKTFTLENSQKPLYVIQDIAERFKFIAVYGEALIQTSGPFQNFYMWGVSPGDMEDVAYTSDVLADVKEDYEIDSNRIYAWGHSNGAQMVYKVAGQMSDTFAAVAAFAGGPIEPSYLNTSRKVPMLFATGTADTTVDPALTEAGKDQAVAAHGLLTSVDLIFDDILLFPNGVRMTSYLPPHEDDEGEVFWFEIYGMNHVQWPEPSSVSPYDVAHGIKGGDVVWDFFARNVLKP